jgi:hypothetical protein
MNSYRVEAYNIHTIMFVTFKVNIIVTLVILSGGFWVICLHNLVLLKFSLSSSAMSLCLVVVGLYTLVKLYYKANVIQVAALSGLFL